MELSHVIEHIGYRPIRAKVASRLSKGMTYLSNCSVSVVGHCFNQKSDSTWTVTLVRQ